MQLNFSCKKKNEKLLCKGQKKKKSTRHRGMDPIPSTKDTKVGGLEIWG